MCDKIFWSSDDEDDDDNVQVAAPKRERVVIAEDDTVSDKKQKSAIHRLSTVDKAGLSDTASRIHAVMAASTNSSFAQNEEKRQKKVDEKIARMLGRLNEVRRDDTNDNDPLHKARKVSVLRDVTKTISTLESSRDLSRTFLCVDMDAFYVACELLDRPDLVGKPVAVGGMSMLSTSSYEARQFGVRSAMPGYMAKQLCPDLIILPCNFEKYTRVAEQARALFAMFDPDFSSHSLDEAILDISDYLEQHAGSTPEEAGTKLKQLVFDATKCTCSVGLGPNRPLAKIASNVKKPDGLFYIKPERDAIVEFVQGLPLRKVCGIGAVTEATLRGIGITTCKDLWDNRMDLARIVKKKDRFVWYLDIALGFPSTSHHQKRIAGERKSISCERTVGHEGIGDITAALAMAKSLCDRLVADMEEAQVAGQTITLKLKGVDFSVHNKSITVPQPISTAQSIWRWLKGMVEDEMRRIGPVRLIGVKMSSLKSLKGG